MTRGVMTIIREIKAIKAEKLLAPHYKAHMLKGLEQELEEAQLQIPLDLPVETKVPPARKG